MTAFVHLVDELELELPLARYVRAFPRSAGTFLLDGGGAPSPRLDEHALLGAEPVLTIRAYRTPLRDDRGRVLARVVVAEERGATREEIGDPFTILRSVIAAHAPPPGALSGAPIPLRAGFVGYFGYELGQTLERLPCRARPSLGMPDMALGLYAWVLGVRRATGAATLSVLGRGEGAAEARADAEARRARVLAALAAEAKVARIPPRAPRRRGRARLDADVASLAEELGIASSLSARAHVAAVEDAKRRIVEGDLFEVCVTSAFDAPFAADPWDLYRELRDANPAPFAAWLDLPEGAVVSASPERFLALDARGVAETRPIKGTRRRSESPLEDARVARDLAASEKDRAENAMIVDLARSDLGRVCRYGTVEVPELYAVESYATVHQLVSTVRGELERGRDAIDLLRAAFPPGSMTGAPKIEAMRVVEALEPVERGVYSGALGWIDLSGTMDLSVVIRTIVVTGGRASLSAGGAVVADSDPAGELDEARDKARALVTALATAADRDEPGPDRVAPDRGGASGAELAS